MLSSQPELFETERQVTDTNVLNIVPGLLNFVIVERFPFASEEDTEWVLFWLRYWPAGMRTDQTILDGNG